MNKKLVASLLTAILFIQSTAFAATNTTNNTTSSVAEANTTSSTTEADSEAAIEQTPKTYVIADDKDDRPVLSLDEAIEKGLKNNLLFQQVQNKAEIAKVVKDNSSKVQTDLANAENDLNSASDALDEARNQISSSSGDLEDAKQALEDGEFPVDITCGTILEMLSDKPDVKAQFQGLMTMNHMTSGTVLAREGDLIDNFCSSHPVGRILAGMGYGKGYITSALKQVLSSKGDELASGKKKFEESTQEYLKGQAEFQASLKYALSSVSSKLSTSTISSLEAKPLGDLIVKMCSKQDELTTYSVDIYRNQVVLLIENSYFEALKQQELLKVKEKSEERGRVQYEMAKAAYEVGMKSRDDMNIAKTYYDSTIMNAELQRKEYNTALLELKKNLNMDQKQEFKLEPIEPDTSESFDLDKGIESGLRLRLEMKMAQANKDLYGYLMTAVSDSGFGSGTNQYKEVKLLQKQADLAYESEKAEVESGIRNSYQTLQSTQKLVETAIDLRENAEATVEMARSKYEVGYGYSNSLLASLNLQQMSGTMVEVIAAEENLANIQEKQIEAMDGYNLAKLKYLNDIGTLTY